MSISKNDYSILKVLAEHQCTTELKSFTIAQIKEFTELSINKIRMAIKMLKLLNYVSEGAVSHSAKTYYITNNGIEKLKTL